MLQYVFSFSRCACKYTNILPCWPNSERKGVGWFGVYAEEMRGCSGGWKGVVLGGVWKCPISRLKTPYVLGENIGNFT